MAEEPRQEDNDVRQDGLLKKAWGRLTTAVGIRLAVVLAALACVLGVLAVVLVVMLAVGLIWYLSPVFSAKSDLSITERKDLVQGLASVAQALAVGLAGAVGFIGLLFTWRSLRQARESQKQTQEDTQRTLDLTEQGQITERFTRAIDQLGATHDNGD